MSFQSAAALLRSAALIMTKSKLTKKKHGGNLVKTSMVVSERPFVLTFSAN